MGSGGGRGELSRHFDGGTVSSPGFKSPHFLPPSAEETTRAIDFVIEDRQRAIDPPTTQRQALGELKNAVQSRLSEGLQVERVNVVGSFAKGTQIRKEGGNDIDLEVVLDRRAHGDWLTQANGPTNCLTKVKSLLESDPRFSSVEIRVDQNVVSAMLDDARVDIAPAFVHEEGGVVIPDTSGGQRWVRTNPRLSKRLLDLKDSRHGGQLIPLIRLAKDWNERNGGRLKSYTIEAMGMRYFDEKPEGGENSPRANTHEFFSRMQWYLQKGAVVDPVFGKPADSYLTPEDRTVLISKAIRIQTKLDRAERLANSAKPERAAELYEEALGG